jgi:hypothetical protein
MQITITGAARRLILALVLGATLTPLAPNTGAVVAKQQITAAERIDAAHLIADRIR